LLEKFKWGQVKINNVDLTPFKLATPID